MMFEEENDAFRTRNLCSCCRWNHTNMCPRRSDYAGRRLENPDRAYTDRDICHRFVMTKEEQEYRWQEIMNKMHENLETDGEQNIPF